MKTIIQASLVTAVLSISAFGSAQASHTLQQPAKKVLETDTHISWHGFRHELTVFPQVSATISHGGLITLNGKVDSAVEKAQIESIAKNVRGVTEIHNYIGTK